MRRVYKNTVHTAYRSPKALEERIKVLARKMGITPSEWKVRTLAGRARFDLDKERYDKGGD